MPSPLPDSVSATLRSDPTAALGALMVIAGAHAELFSWAARMVCDATSAARVEPQPKPSERASREVAGRPQSFDKRSAQIQRDQRPPRVEA